ncbi:Uncharacterized protein DAT39_017990 [Clarias magur]|uniref:Uncharacterized protein n=1 Tax=Clarias magur TaxID=1594786 RepID=A0A8J4TKH1_CLAMG|nr:Uncharacterized protein DAT39_017990 [Clarias magur]
MPGLDHGYCQNHRTAAVRAKNDKPQTNVCALFKEVGKITADSPKRSQLSSCRGRNKSVATRYYTLSNRGEDDG